jgi:hypothetical protein
MLGKVRKVERGGREKKRWDARKRRTCMWFASLCGEGREEEEEEEKRRRKKGEGREGGWGWGGGGRGEEEGEDCYPRSKSPKRNMGVKTRVTIKSMRASSISPASIACSSVSGVVVMTWW